MGLANIDILQHGMGSFLKKDMLSDFERNCVSLVVRGNFVLASDINLYGFACLDVRKGHTFSLLGKSMKFGTDELDTILFQNFDGTNLRC